MISENISILVSCFLEAEKTSPISFQVPGKIVKINFDLGDHVTENQVVAEVEKDDYQSRLEIAQAQFMEAEDAFNRLKILFEEGVIPEKTFIEISSGLAQARAGMNIAQKQLRDTRLRAPFAGVIGMKKIETGQMISTGLPVFSIVKNDRIYACSSIPESEIAHLKTGQKAMVVVPSLGDRFFCGTVERIGPVAAPKTRTYRVKILLDNPGFILRPGMIANVSIETDRKMEILTIPSRAVVRDSDNLTYVFLADKKTSRAFRKRVFPGSVHRSEIRIKKGLSAGDLLVLSGQHKLTDGSDIRIIEN
ncbi:MAG: efflux RND transporter periplasmic adaptor subunit [Desulfobacterium sp.]|nr:efflux RND transporter periplasmic adaptor subunit [Desulfobacterium sp.]